jgi:hypothetical protein
MLQVSLLNQGHFMENHWRSFEEYCNGKDHGEEQESDLVDASASRRDFLKLFGFSIASAAVLSSCEKPVQKAIPYLIRPEEVTPGKASYYASTFDGTEYRGILVRSGRAAHQDRGNSNRPSPVEGLQPGSASVRPL